MQRRKNITRLRPRPDHQTHLSLRGSRDDLLSILVVADARGGSTVAATDAGSDTVNLVSDDLPRRTYPLVFNPERMFRRVEGGSVFQQSSQGSSKAHTPRGRSCHTPREDNVPDNLAVDSARDTVLQLKVHLGDGVLREDGSIRDVTCRKKLLALFLRAGFARSLALRFPLEANSVAATRGTV